MSSVDPIVTQALSHPALQRGSRKPRPMAHVADMEEQDIHGPRKMVVLATALLFGAFFTWASTERMAETAVTSGQIAPRQSVLKIQHLEGGIVREVKVEEGQRVKAGDVLLRLQPEAAHAEEGQLRARKAALSMQAERLRAFAGGQNPDFANIALDLEGLGNVHDGQMAIFQAQQQALADRQAVLTARQEQRRSELAGLKRERDALERRTTALRSEQDVYRELFQKGYGSKLNMLRAQSELASAEAERARVIGQLESAEGSLSEIEQQFAELVSGGREEMLDRMGQVRGELAEVEEAIGRTRDRVARLELHAPVEGIVKGLTVRMAGEVVAPGQVILEVVPTEGGLAVETRVATRDVGALEIGQLVRIKITAFDFARYGAIDGHLEQVSATTFLDENGQPYFKARIGLSQDWVGRRENVIMPGMVVQADINTGNKTLLEYLLKPIYVATTQAFNER